MENLVGKTARLPHGQRVVIEEIINRLAVVRRLEKPMKGTIAICAVSSLLTGEGSANIRLTEENP